MKLVPLPLSGLPELTLPQQFIPQLAVKRGKPKMVVSDNGSELTLTWADHAPSNGIAASAS